MNTWRQSILGGLGRLQWLSMLAGILMFAVLNLLLTLLVHNSQHAVIPINILAAILAAVIGPHLLRTIDGMQQTLTRQNSELRSLHAVDSALAARLDLPAILDIAIRETVLAVSGEVGVLWLFDESDPQRIAARAYDHISPAMQTVLGDGIGATERAEVRRTGQSVRRQELDGTWGRDRIASLLKLRNTLAVPITGAGGVLGVLWIGNRADTTPLQGFTDEDMSLLTGIASTLAVAIQNARLYDETQRRGSILRTLVARTGDAVSASSDAPRLMQILAEEASRILNCPRVAVYAWDDAPVKLHPYAPAGFEPLAYHDEVSPDETVPLAMHTPLHIDRAHLPSETTGGGPGGAAPYVVSVHDALGLPADEAPFLKTPGYLYVLRARDRRGIGLLCLLDAAFLAASPERDAFAHALAAQAAVGLENALLAQQAQSLLARTQAMQEATNQIASDLDTGRVLRGVMDSARRILEADGCALWDYLPPEGDNRPAGQWARRAAQGLLMEPGTDSGYEEEILMSALAGRTPQTVFPRGGPPQGPGHVRSLLALPLLYGGEATGAMTLYYESPRALNPEEVSLAQNFAFQAANALQNARLFANLNASYERERRIAETLQKNLTSLIPPRVHQFEFAHLYKAALGEAEIGGDFYDVFDLGGGKVGVVMADVSGKGLKAAVQTAMVKYTLRAFAAAVPDKPADVLARVNDVLSSNLGIMDGFVTLFYGVLDTNTGHMAFANAGHEAPFWRRAAPDDTIPLDSDTGLPLGCFPGSAYEATEVTLAPGELLFLFTDGMSEARTENGDFLGTDALRDLVPTNAADADAACETLFARVRAFSNDRLRDDVSLLVLRHVPPPAAGTP